MDAEEQEYADAHGTAWCTACGRHVAVADSYPTDTGDAEPRVLAFTARPLYCGHNDHSPYVDQGRPSDDGAAALAVLQRQTQDRLARTAAAQDSPS